ncbi:unnamed protein product [Clavelina lepadiformis]|uniref:Uncharacterized protein n=1 Tax=Clavelina lepadiformis TaxID=159417 RepID=A0ABP0F8D4_CLALP
MVKVICVGPPKTGTKSTARALRILGYNEVWDYEEALEFGFNEWWDVFKNRNVKVQDVIEKLYTKNVEAVVDMPHSHYFEFFLERWPDAKIILMTRKEDSWYNSFKNMLESAQKDHPFLWYLQFISPASHRMTQWHNDMLSALGSSEPNPLKWKMWFRRHNAYVKSVVPKNQLLVYNVEHGWGPLCEFLEKDVPGEDFPFENKAGSKTSIAERVIEESSIVKQVKLEATLILGLGPIILAFVFYSLYAYFN